MTNKPDQPDPFDFEIVDGSEFINKRYRISDEANDLINELYPDILKEKKITIKKLHRSCKKYPHIPQFKNYLALAYDNSGNHQKAIEINDQLLAEHPNYLFARINKAQDLMDNNDFDRVPDLLGKEMHIHILYPDRDMFHIDGHEILLYRHSLPDSYRPSG